MSEYLRELMLISIIIMAQLFKLVNVCRSSEMLLFKACMEEGVVTRVYLTVCFYDVTYAFQIHSSKSVVFQRRICNGICDLILCLKNEGLIIS